MKETTFSGKMVQHSRSRSQQEVSAGPEGVAIVPPAHTYGIDAIDNESVAAVHEPQSFESATWSGGGAIQRKSVRPGAGSNAFGNHRESKTGLPDKLKVGLKNLSGLSMDDVKVRYNSVKPARLQALAFTQGTDIHLGPGQERHLPHEAWHAVQQKQGRVKPTLQDKGVSLNDDLALEREADVMGARAAKYVANGTAQKTGVTETGGTKINVPVTQRYSEIDIVDPKRWEEVKGTFMGFKPTLEVEDQEELPKYTMKYEAATPESSKVYLSDGQKLAISADSTIQHTVFFIDSTLLRQSNKELDDVGSGYRLKPTGDVMKISDGVKGSHLQQVEADPYRMQKEIRGLDTQCNKFKNNISKKQEKARVVFKEIEEEATSGHTLSPERRIELAKALDELEIAVGAVWSMKAFGKELDEEGWGSHYEAVVAVDGHDNVTLANYNRFAEFETILNRYLKDLYGYSTRGKWDLEEEKKDLLSERKKVGWFGRKNKEKKEKIDKRVKEIEGVLKQLENATKDFELESKDTHYFKMYGPASKGQTFLDVWASGMSGTSTLEFSGVHKDE